MNVNAYELQVCKYCYIPSDLTIDIYNIFDISKM